MSNWLIFLILFLEVVVWLLYHSVTEQYIRFPLVEARKIAKFLCNPPGAF